MQFEQEIPLTATRQKAVLLIIDGCGDLPAAALNGLTPLEAARTPVLDRLAGAGLYGLVDPIQPGEVPNTDSGVGLLMGLAPDRARSVKRGPVEAAGAGRPLEAGEVAMRANFATIESRQGELWVSDRRAGRITRGTPELAAALNGMDLGDGVRAEFRSTDQHRGVLVLIGPGLGPDVSGTDPGDRVIPARVRTSEPRNPASELTAAKINRFVKTAHEILPDHPVNHERQAGGRPLANGIITRGAGARVESRNVLHDLGLRVAAVAGCNTALGLSRLFGFDTVYRPSFTADQDTNLEDKVAAALEALDAHELVYIHVKAPDLFAHDHDPVGKRDFIERLDRSIRPLATAGIVVALASDHTTDSNTGVHTADPVPSLLFDPSVAHRSDGEAVSFGESSCRLGNMPRQRSHQLLDRVLRCMGYAP